MPKTTKKDKLQQAHERLTEAVESIVSDDDWHRMLKVASKFHNYSFNNQLMIFLQRPDATYVAGFNRWRSLGRTVRKGEKGIAVFAPCKYRTKVEMEDGEEQTLQQVRGFRVVHVFDISQTEGEALEDLDAVRPKLLDGAAPEGVWDALVAQANAAGFEVIRDQRGSANGYCDFLAKTISVRSDVSEAQALKTLVHELAHALLHTGERPKTAAIAEIEVESVAFVVCDAIGLDASDYSFSYITDGHRATWRKSKTRGNVWWSAQRRFWPKCRSTDNQWVGTGEREAVYRPRKTKQLFLTLVCLVFVAIGMTLMERAAAWFVALFFGVGALIFIIQLLPNASYLRLTREGFEIRSLFRSGFTRWGQVADIGVTGDSVVLIFTEEAGAERSRRVAYELRGAEGILPDTYGHRPDVLADLMWQWKVEHTHGV